MNFNPYATSMLPNEYWDYYHAGQSYEQVWDQFSCPEEICNYIKKIWDVSKPYSLLDSGSANGVLVDALRQSGVNAWGIENNQYIHGKTPKLMQPFNIIGDICSLPFSDKSFDFIYDTALCYVERPKLTKVLSEFRRVARIGVLHQTLMRIPIALKYSDYAKSILTPKRWSDLYLANGFSYAIKSPKTAECILKNLSSNSQDQSINEWFPTSRIFRKTFYSVND